MRPDRIFAPYGPPSRASLIANAVVYYNSLNCPMCCKVLNAQGDAANVDNLKRVSWLVWQSVNFYSRYPFESNTVRINSDEIAKKLAPQQLKGRWSRNSASAENRRFGPETPFTITI